MIQRIILVVICFLALIGIAVAQTEEEAELPEKFKANLMVINAPGQISGMEQISITVERWTTDEERNAMFVALRDGGTDVLVKAMQEMDAGYIQIGMSLGWRLRVASTWQTEEGRNVRIATDRPVHIMENYQGTRSRDYPIGLIEFILPPEGKGEGTLLAATQVRFDDQGRIEVKSLPNNTGAQTLSMVQKVMPKKKKTKKKKKDK
jgi:hypothetical protein